MPAAGLSGCGAATSVVVYTAVDQVFSEPVLRQFSEETGLSVRQVYDVEAAKTTGLVNRLIAEKDNPRCDAFWSNEFIQTIHLKEQGVLAAYDSPSAQDIPAAFRDKDGYWTGFGGRARVLIINTGLVKPGQVPATLLDLAETGVDPTKIGIALPVFGTTATHAAALYAELGRDAALAWHRSLRDKGVRVVDGNSVVRDKVANGELAMGMTDTDDAYGAVSDGKPVQVVYLDQQADDMGTLVNPNTVALIAGSPNPDGGRQFVDWLLKPSTEALLLRMGWIDLPCRDVGETSGNLGDRQVRGMTVNLADIYTQWEDAKTDMAGLFVR